jgi:hypothetical protein
MIKNTNGYEAGVSFLDDKGEETHSLTYLIIANWYTEALSIAEELALSNESPGGSHTILGINRVNKDLFYYRDTTQHDA